MEMGIDPPAFGESRAILLGVEDFVMAVLLSAFLLSLAVLAALASVAFGSLLRSGALVAGVAGHGLRHQEKRMIGGTRVEGRVCRQAKVSV